MLHNTKINYINVQPKTKQNEVYDLSLYEECKQ